MRTTGCKKRDQECVVRLRNESRSYPTPPLSDLPEQRVSEGSLFYNTGVDFTGPFYVQDTHADS